jgi:hypothetical protein
MALFSQIAYLNLVFITLTAIAHFASAITEEKEDGTLGLLRMTRLSPVSILLGKSATRVWYGITLLLAQLPFTFLCITLGGVSRDQVLAAYATTGAWLILTASLALLCSVVCNRTRAAGALTLVLLVLLFLVPLVSGIAFAMQAWGWMTASNPVHVALTRFGDAAFAASPFVRMSEILGIGFRGSIVGFQVWSNLALSAVLFVFSWLVFDFFARERRPVVTTRARASGKKRPSLLRGIRPGRVWSAALVWKEFWFQTGGRSAIIFKSLAFGLLFGGVSLLLLYHDVFEREGMGVFIMLVMLGAGIVELAFYMSRIFNDELRSGTLSHLILLPTPVWSIAYQKIGGCLVALLPEAMFFGLGVLIAPDAAFNGLAELASHPVRVVYWVVALLLFYHLATYLSVRVKQASLLLAVALFWVGLSAINIAIFIAVELIEEATGSYGGYSELMLNTASVITSFFLLVLTYFLHRAIGRRLVKAAQ